VTDSEQTHVTWRIRTASNSSSCVEVVFADELVLVRNSRDPLGPPSLPALSFRG
jgi:Domain of unknown function (DUF397)